MTQISNSTLQFSTPQDIGLASTPQFATVKFGSLAAKAAVYLDASQQLASVALTNGQLLIGNTGNIPTAATLTGTANQVIVTNGAGSITLSLPQSIATTSLVQFGTLSTIGQCVGSLSYSTGTASQQGTAVIGAGGASWNSSFVPGVICWAGPVCSVVTAFVNSTQLTSINSQTVPNGAYSLCYGDIEMAQGTLLVSGSIYTTLPANRVMKTDANSVVSTTGAMTNGQLIIGSTGADVVLATLTVGASNSITIVNGAGSITIDTAQPLTSTSAPTFSSLTLSGLSPNMALVTGPSSGLITGISLNNGQFVIGATGAAPIAASITGTTNQVIVTNGANSITLSLPQNINTGASPTFNALTLSSLTQHRLVLVGASGAPPFVGRLSSPGGQVFFPMLLRRPTGSCLLGAPALTPLPPRLSREPPAQLRSRRALGLSRSTQCRG